MINSESKYYNFKFYSVRQKTASLRYFGILMVSWTPISQILLVYCNDSAYLKLYIKFSIKVSRKSPRDNFFNASVTRRVRNIFFDFDFLFIFRVYRITCLYLPVASKWLYVGTDKGNIHVINIESFTLSGYIINWNKAIEV